jgi:hypothetical protein
MPSFDLHGFLAVVAAFVDQAEFDQSSDDGSVGFVQDPHDIPDGQMMISEEVANRCLALKGRV